MSERRGPAALHTRPYRELTVTVETTDEALDRFLGPPSTWVAWTLSQLAHQHGRLVLTLDETHDTLYVASKGRKRIETFHRGPDGMWLFTFGLAPRHLKGPEDLRRDRALRQCLTHPLSRATETIR